LNSLNPFILLSNRSEFLFFIDRHKFGVTGPGRKKIKTSDQPTKEVIIKEKFWCLPSSLTLYISLLKTQEISQ